MSNIRQRKVIRRFKKVGIILISLYILVGALIYFTQEKMLFYKMELPQDYTYTFSYPFEELFFKTEKDAVINAIHFKVKTPKGVILYFHGNGSNLPRLEKISGYFIEKGYEVLIMDYRGYGKSTGVLSEGAFYNDAQYCYNYLKAHYDESDIILYGRSIGTGIATFLASENNPQQLILEAPYHSIEDVANRRFPIYPTKGMLKYKFPSFKYISNVKCPISIFHGTDDFVISFKSGKRLFSDAPKALATFIEIEGGRHTNLNHFKAYHNQMAKLLP
ncbi:alpha/beta fold hydrolase [Flavivirga abyssicola]|uniref:alpha/beta hydrolase n=1 Tax=Flavivirga abyssicola TaxID=3063533 RepID=UPI0026E0DB76|nr:alpha/beta fold hydrolase [Flavivirga sp. MEBiC07777]WVK14090.1 alpha/beta fold hydrolase [Flavivirga sp. MEBiC07777]